MMCNIYLFLLIYYVYCLSFPVENKSHKGKIVSVY